MESCASTSLRTRLPSLLRLPRDKTAPQVHLTTASPSGGGRGGYSNGFAALRRVNR
jgi:hypothetical protein